MTSPLIYDLGLHLGKDAEFYLRKGFDVVAIEANPRLARTTAERLQEFVASGRLQIVEKAIWGSEEESIPFFVNDDKDDWSSAFRGAAEQGICEVTEIRVQTTTISKMFDRFGVPYYMKVDLEGVDAIVAWGLLRDHRRPKYVSFELTSLEILAALLACGYHEFQLVNQTYNFSTRVPCPPLEGGYIDQRFDGHMSGLFGRELDQTLWRKFEETASLYLDFVSVRDRDANVASGWLDVHCRASA